MKALITDDYSSIHNKDIQPTETLNAPLVLFNLQDSWSRGMTEQPTLLQARLAAEKAGIQLKFDKNQLYPELDVIGSYGWNGQGVLYNGSLSQIGRRANRLYYSYGAQLIVPLANQSARNIYKADKVTLQQVLLQLKQSEQNVLVSIDNAVKTAESDYQRVYRRRATGAHLCRSWRSTRTKDPDAVGKATTFEVLQYQNSLTTARGNEIRALANYEEDLANLASAEVAP